MLWIYVLADVFSLHILILAPGLGHDITTADMFTDITTAAMFTDITPEVATLECVLINYCLPVLLANQLFVSNE